MFLTWWAECAITLVKGRLLRWLVERKNGMDVEMYGAFQLRSMAWWGD